VSTVAGRGPGISADLSEGQIVNAAVELIGRDGFAAFSMRKLAGVLGVSATALYRHVPTRQHLLDLVADRYFDEIDLADHGDWKEFLTVFLRSVHHLLLERPLLAEVLIHQPVDGVTALRLSNTILGRLRRAGFDSRTAVEILTNLGSFTLGFAMHQSGRAGARAKDPAERAARLREQTAHLYPELAVVADEWVRWSVEENFESGLRRLIDSYDKGVAL
jgi:AcrR family transcriptional regulator